MKSESEDVVRLTPYKDTTEKQKKIIDFAQQIAQKTLEENFKVCMHKMLELCDKDNLSQGMNLLLNVVSNINQNWTNKIARIFAMYLNDSNDIVDLEATEKKLLLEILEGQIHVMIKHKERINASTVGEESKNEKGNSGKHQT